MGIVFAILAVVGSCKVAKQNRSLNSGDVYVKVEDGYEVESDPRASMIDVYGDLKPIHVKLLKIIERIADEEAGLSIKERKIGARQVKPCFVGFRFIDWALREKLAANRTEAVNLGKELIRKRYVGRSDGKEKKAVALQIFNLFMSKGKTSSTHKSKRGRELAEFVDDAVFYYFAVQERPKLFKPLDDDVRERLLYGFRPAKAGTPGLLLMPVGIFVIPLATSGMGLMWLGLATVYLVGDLLYVGFVFSGLALVLYFGCLIAYGIKAFRHFAAVRDEWNHPFKMNLFGVISLTLLNFTAIAAFIDVTLTTVLFYIATPLQLLITFLAAARWLSVARGLNDINPSYFIPIVGLAAIPVASVPVGNMGLGFLILGASIIYWLLMFALQFLRIFFVGSLPRSALPMLFLSVAPPCLLTTAYITLIQPLGGIPPATPDLFAQLLFGIALFNTCLFTMIRLVTPRVPFMLSHWGYVFPLTAFAIACQRYASIMRAVSGTANGLTILLVIISLSIASIMWAWAAFSTVYYAFGRRLIAREAKVLSEETAEKVYQGKIVSSHHSNASSRGSNRDSGRESMARDSTMKSPRK